MVVVGLKALGGGQGRRGTVGELGEGGRCCMGILGRGRSTWDGIFQPIRCTVGSGGSHAPWDCLHTHGSAGLARTSSAATSMCTTTTTTTTSTTCKIASIPVSS